MLQSFPCRYVRGCYVIDLDYATYYFVGTEQDVNKGHRTGTVPFTAIEIFCDGSNTTNRPTHDLESLFYVLLWICSNYSRPNNSIRNDKDMLIWCGLTIFAVSIRLATLKPDTSRMKNISPTGYLITTHHTQAMFKRAMRLVCCF